MASLAINEDELEYLVNWEIINPSDTESNDDVCSLNSWSSEINPNPNIIIDSKNDIPNVVFAYDEDDDDLKRYVIGDNDDDVSDDDDDGLDDELVPRYVSGKVGRDRMRKLGKRGFAKMNNSKRVPYSFVKPGCVYGKHGLGFKHSF